MKKILILAAALVLLLGLAGTAMAANVFLFTERSVSVNEGETYAS